MPTYQALTPATFAALRWQRPHSFRFAASDALAPLVAQELPKACLHLPTAFIAQDDAFVPVAVQGVQPGHNLWVAPDGRWLGHYTPAAYRGYPFALASTEGHSEQVVLCVDTDSGLVGEGLPEAFFDDAGQPSPAIREVLNFLQQVHAHRALTQRLCAAVQAEGLIQPWPITVQGGGGTQTLQGLYRIDEARFNALGAEALHRLHQAGALALVYCQLLSMQHLQALGALAQAHVQAKAQAAARTALPTTPTGDLDLEFLNRSHTLRFGGL